MPSDISFLKFVEDEHDQDSQDIYAKYLALVANGKMHRYKQIIHERGDKQGQSYYGHVIDLTSIASKLCRLLTSMRRKCAASCWH